MSTDVLDRTRAALRLLDECRPALVARIKTLHRQGSPELNEYLEVAHRAGFSLDALGRVLGITRQGVHARIRKGSPYRLTEQDIAELRALRAEADGRAPSKREQTARYRARLAELNALGVSAEALGRALGVSGAAITVQLRLWRQSQIRERAAR